MRRDIPIEMGVFRVDVEGQNGALFGKEFQRVVHGWQDAARKVSPRNRTGIDAVSYPLLQILQICIHYRFKFNANLLLFSEIAIVRDFFVIS